jgi:hypothetical protein
LVHANHSRWISSSSRHWTWYLPQNSFCLMTWTCLMLPSTVFHASWCKTNVMTARALVVTWSIVLTRFLNRIITGDETWCLLYGSQLR